ncbi:hypothetical protein Theam_1738 (plasmid) [Thermovibrio ammonificans HB-1]|uniref:Uncharacterized protein n=1 Tax=Thermovibrio ammonificans (strain DSM 15698 / JCM 12110 / HB-1) TaxID=648996 RepID=E8T6X3_THEA1|nr:hypothetical protein [Thermovibrio ammonificans]ADU97694.1 hypothetical protein Theam_1738 [Thermovibrio ammonificans HB-1]
MSRANVKVAAKKILSLVRSCPEAKFFVSESILREILRIAPKSLIEEIKFRLIYIPHGFIPLIANLLEILHEKGEGDFPTLRKKSFGSTKAIIHDTLFMKRGKKEFFEEMIELLEKIGPITPDILVKYPELNQRLTAKAKNLLFKDYEELERVRREAIKLMKCALKYF